MLIRRKANMGAADTSRSQFYTSLETEKKKPPPRPPPPKTKSTGVDFNKQLNNMWDKGAGSQKVNRPTSWCSTASDYKSQSSNSWASQGTSATNWTNPSNTGTNWTQNAAPASKSNWPKPSNPSWQQKSRGWSQSFESSWGSQPSEHVYSNADERPGEQWPSTKAPVPQPRHTGRNEDLRSSSSPQDLINWSSSPHPSPSLSLHSDGNSVASSGNDSQLTGTSASSGFDEDFDPFSPRCLEKKKSSSVFGPRVLPPTNNTAYQNTTNATYQNSQKPPITAKPASSSVKPTTHAISRPTVIKPKPKARMKPELRATSPPHGGPSNQSSARSSPDPWNMGTSPSPTPQIRHGTPSPRPRSTPSPLSSAIQQWETHSARSSSPFSDSGAPQWNSSRSSSPAQGSRGSPSPYSAGPSGNSPSTTQTNTFENPPSTQRSMFGKAPSTTQTNTFGNSPSTTQTLTYGNSPSPYGFAAAKVENIYYNIDESDRETSPPMPCQPAPQLPLGADVHDPSPPPLPPRPSSHAGEGVPHGIALYDYSAEQQDDLSFKEGQTVVIVRSMNRDWMWGRVGRKEGMFPSSFIRVVVPVPGQKTAMALYTFQATHDDEISFPEGAIIEVLAVANEEWLSGKYEEQQGLFPANYIDCIPPNLPALS